ncbi:MAG: hypothetical protein KC777_21660 [Cyanobacteria bacterium HKST-UBA02]|nr:hypothetical protein [Cyanobacteria bacterium HKST-UBA02]
MTSRRRKTEERKKRRLKELDETQLQSRKKLNEINGGLRQEEDPAFLVKKTDK